MTINQERFTAYKTLSPVLTIQTTCVEKKAQVKMYNVNQIGKDQNGSFVIQNQFSTW